MPKKLTKKQKITFLEKYIINEGLGVKEPKAVKAILRSLFAALKELEADGLSYKDPLEDSDVRFIEELYFRRDLWELLRKALYAINW